jgi:hypothetical protein
MVTGIINVKDFLYCPKYRLEKEPVNSDLNELIFSI